MARKAEEGLRYFPMNTDIVTNPKIRLVVLEFGPKAWAVVLPLMCKLYREKGYYLDWSNEDVKLLFATEECRCELPFVSEVVQGLVRRGVFDKAVFDKFKVLTSDRIQENYLEGRSRSKRVEILKEYTLIDINAYTNAESVSINPINANNCTQRKEKKSKEEESNTSATPPNPRFLKFQAYIQANAPDVGKMKEPFTEDQFTKLLEKFPVETIQKLVSDMHNWKDLTKKRKSAYLTFLKFAENDKGRPVIQPNTNNSHELSAREKADKELLKAAGLYN